MEKVHFGMTTAQHYGFPLHWRTFFRVGFHPQLLSGEGLGICSGLNKETSSQGHPCVSNLGLGLHRREGIFHWGLLENTWMLGVCSHSPNSVSPNHAALDSLACLRWFLCARWCPECQRHSLQDAVCTRYRCIQEPSCTRELGDIGLTCITQSRQEVKCVLNCMLSSAKARSLRVL